MKVKTRFMFGFFLLCLKRGRGRSRVCGVEVVAFRKEVADD